jgi:hypothetical protein
MTARTAHARSAIDSQLTGETVYRPPSNLKHARTRSDNGYMSNPMLAIPYIVLWVVMMRALLVRAQILPPTCSRCGRPYERRDLGESICSCSR